MNETPQSSTIPQCTMLIIDDEHSVRVSLEFLLAGAGYKILTAESGAAAVALAERESVDGALIDVHMPVMNGFDTCIRLQTQASAGGRALRIWFMTGAFTRTLERKSVDLGALGVLAKPFDFAVLLARLEQGFASPPPEFQPAPEMTEHKGESDETG